MRSKFALGFLSLVCVVAAWAQRPEALAPSVVIVSQQQVATAPATSGNPAKDPGPAPTGPSDLERYALLLAGVGAVLFLVSRRERD